MRSSTRTIRTVPVPATTPRSALVRALSCCYGALSGRNRRLALISKRSRQRFDQLDFDQQVREVGEW